MQQLETSQTDWYTRLVSPLSETDKKSLQEVFTLANQRRNARESKTIEQSGGKYFICELNNTSFTFLTDSVIPLLLIFFIYF